MQWAWGTLILAKKTNKQTVFFIVSDIINPCCCVNIVGVLPVVGGVCTDVTILKVKLHWVHIPGNVFLFISQHSTYANNVPLVKDIHLQPLLTFRQPIDGSHECFVGGRYLFHCMKVCLESCTRVCKKWVCLISKVQTTWYSTFARTYTSWRAPWGVIWTDKRISVKASPGGCCSI